ncbi:gliding motility-associated ABC transporter permease subunit GldF [Solitalea canadensis]|uniref:Gliding motility-associated ABC transporter permease protein GldF n=1 Tax=Solitalea canadensis (strain ATCC 29591 / DSM 3403 / JCM 21819 / LMG 8368 / NBRC 15130 / NCIMB 12057 / USAM 9D) TaxID=929556 RepID=H8KNZ9_SOLCM|nr:gliding motility-associated ABC transporter permease subunit GldF [Solitalea canadensis]AFD05521.1 gliding motility-associated ABC transporter permease protein GldF [Solitalea canadensis DSM 3403]
MLTILKKEISGFFNSMVAYVTIIFFLVITGLFLWVFPESSILDYGYAGLDSLFYIAPYVFMFLIPAITMRSFAEEKKEGTFELLTTQPVTDWQIILGKFGAGLFLVVFSLLPTLVYYFSVYELGATPGNLDSGAVIGSYIGLLLLGCAFASIGIFSSSITNNQIVAFIVAVFICFIAFSGFESISSIASLGYLDSSILNMGINAHYQSISRGVLDTRDLIYFLSFSALFLAATKTVLSTRKW